MDRKSLIIMLRSLADSAGIDVNDIFRKEDGKAANSDPRKAYRAAMLKATLDSAESWARRRTNDAQEALFVRNLVVQTLAEIERHEFPEAKWVNGGLLTMRSEINEGADTYQWLEYGVVTEGAKLLSNDSDDLPLVDLTGAVNAGVVKTWGAAFQYTTQDVRKARLQGTFDLVNDKAAAVREAMDRLLNSLIAFGNGPAGLEGIFSATGIVVDTASTADWAGAATSAQIVTGMRDMYTAITTPTVGVEEPDTFLTTQAIMTKLQTTVRDSAAGDMLILDFLKKSYPMIKRWDWTVENLTAGEGGTPCNLMFNGDPKKIRGEIPLQPVTLPEEQHGRKFRVETEGRYGGLIVKRPASIVRLDGV